MDILKGLFQKAQNFTNDIISNKYYSAFVTILTIFGIATNLVIPTGILILVLVTCIFLFSEDALSALGTIMCGIMVMTPYYEDYLELVKYWPLLIAPSLAFIFNIIYYRGEHIKGRFLPSLILVSLALIVGGIGDVKVKDYFSVYNAYYTLGLGLFLAIGYVFLSSRISRPSVAKNSLNRMAEILYASAIIAGFLILFFYIENWGDIWPDFDTPFIPYRNFCTAVMLLGLPCPCLFAIKNKIHLIFWFLLYAVMLISGSRSAFLFGTVEMVLCIMYMRYHHNSFKIDLKKTLFIYAIPIAVICSCIVIFIYFGETGRIEASFINPNETRIKLYEQAIKDFFDRPLNGFGIINDNNEDIFKRDIVPGGIMFCHNSILQIASSLGMIGIIAYSYQFIQRIKLIIEKLQAEDCIFGISFVGITLISLVNPGIFCPIPEAMLVVSMFSVLEYHQSVMKSFDTKMTETSEKIA